MLPQEPESQFELNQGLQSSLSNAFLPRRLSPPSSPPRASIPSGYLSRAFLSRSNAFPSRRLSPPHGSLSGRLSPPSSPPHAPIPSSLPHAFSSSKNTFTYGELVHATDDFSDANLLGQGGFGYVHRGILPKGKEVAVKQLKAGSRQGESEFQAEVEIISRVHHKHLVSLVGYCSTGSQMLLAYEFVPNNTLEFHLHEKGGPTIDWSRRQRIALGSAKGLAYLHEDCYPKIIHRDIKSANILVDFNFEAKVADFGLAKDAPDHNTHVSTRVMGTFGYLDPEYAGSGQLTDKSDVFSYGVVLLELLTGRRPIDKAQPRMHVSLVEWARPFFMRDSKRKNSLVDPRLENEFDSDEMTRMVACAEACTRQSAKDRPKMRQVVRVLEKAVSIADLKAKVTPGHSRDYNSQQDKEDMTMLKKIAFNIKGKWK